MIVWGGKCAKKKNLSFLPHCIEESFSQYCHQAFECEHIQVHLNVQH